MNYKYKTVVDVFPIFIFNIKMTKGRIWHSNYDHKPGLIRQLAGETQGSEDIVTYLLWEVIISNISS